MLLFGAWLAAGCASGGPTPPPPLNSPERAGEALVSEWNAELDAVEPAHPSLLALQWHPARVSERVDADSLILTGARSAVTLQIPARALREPFLRQVGDGRVVGYRLQGDVAELDLGEQKLFPFRDDKDVNAPAVPLQGTVTQVRGTVMVCDDHAAVRTKFATVTARTMEGAPSGTASPLHVKKGLGFRGKDVSALPEADRKRLGLPDARGVFVDEVFPQSPASRAGLQASDVIRSVAGKPVSDRNALAGALSRAPGGKPLAVEVFRPDAGADLTIHITLGSFQGNPLYVSPQPAGK